MTKTFYEYGFNELVEHIENTIKYHEEDKVRYHDYMADALSHLRTAYLSKTDAPSQYVCELTANAFADRIHPRGNK